MSAATRRRAPPRHLAIDVIDRVPGLGQRAVEVRQWLTDQRARHHAYIIEYGEDLPEIRDWQWTL